MIDFFALVLLYVGYLRFFNNNNNNNNKPVGE